MNKYTNQELTKALSLVCSTITNCEKMQLKFAEGTAQHSLLKNRIKALYISKSLLTDENMIATYTNEELLKALPPISSIISKCEKAFQNATEGTAHYTRLQNIITAMSISKSLITDEINKRD